jgi:hypothetical protein
MLKIINVKKWQNAIKPLTVSRRVLFEAFIVCSCTVAFVNFWLSRLSVVGVSVFFMLNFSKYFLGGFFSFCLYNIQHCFICRPSNSNVPTDAGIELRTVATDALAVKRSNH